MQKMKTFLLTLTFAVAIFSSPVLASAYVFNRSLDLGFSGRDVSVLQQILEERGFFAYPRITGFFGPITERGVQSFQREAGIVSTGTPLTTGYGRVGPLTIRALNAISVDFSELFFNRDLKYGMSGEDVKNLQKFLNTNGFLVSESGPGSPGNETSFFGNATRIALSKFQLANGIYPAVGYFGELTREKVYSISRNQVTAESLEGETPTEEESVSPITEEEQLGPIIVEPRKIRSGGSIIRANPTMVLSSDSVREGGELGPTGLLLSINNYADPYVWSLIDDDNGIWDIDPDTGELLLQSEIDYETKTSSSIQVRSDNNTGNPITEDFTIQVIDVPNASEVGTVADNGATTPLFASVREAAFYNSSLDKTVFAWEAYSNGQRRANVSTYDHSTNSFGAIVDSGIPGLLNNAHGVPAILQDHEGYGHLFGGSHGGLTQNMQHAVTNTPNNFTAWTVQDSIPNDYGYPHPISLGNSIYLFMRRANAGLGQLVLRKTSSLSDGSATWADEVPLLNLGTDPGSYTARVYAGNFMAVGTEIWFVAQVSPANDLERKNVYFFRYDTVTGNILNYDGSVTVSSENLPILRVQADIDFILYEHQGTNKGTDIPVWFLDSNNRAHIFYSVGPNDGPFSVMYMYDTGSGWSVPEVAATVYHRYDVYAPVLLQDGSIEFYYTVPINDPPFYDGEIMLKTRSTDGVWSIAQKIIENDGLLIGRIVPIQNGHSEARVMFTELADGSLDSQAGNKRLFIYGDNGFLSRSQAPVNTSLPVVSGSIEVGETLVGTEGEWSRYPTSLSYEYQWFADGIAIVGATGSTYQITEDESEAAMTLRVTATNSVGSSSATSVGISANSWNSLASIPGTSVYNGVPKLVHTGGDYIYSGSIDLSNNFWRYSISNNTWSRMADAPNTFQNYTSSVYVGGNYIYVTRGQGSKTFWRYSISDNSWSNLADTEFNLGVGSHIIYGGGDYLYLRQGGTPTVFRYSISTDTWADWTTIAQSPARLMWSELSYDGNNYIYALPGDNNNIFYRYSITNNIWNTLEPAPANIAAGGSAMAYNGNNYIYTFRGTNTTDFWRYSIDTDTWVALPATPVNVHWGGSLIKAGNYLYGRSGGGGSDFWRYFLGG